MTEAIRLRAAALLRVSTYLQATEGTSLPAQRADTHEDIDRRGWEWVGDYVEEEGISGAAEHRPDVERLLADVRSGLVQAVLVAAVDRATRNTRQFLNTVHALDEAGAIFVSAREPFDATTSFGRYQRDQLAINASFVRERIIENTGRGRRDTLRRGFWIGGPTRYGLTTEKDAGSKHKRVVLDEAEVATLHAAAGLLLDDGLAPAEAAERLNALGHRPRKAARWTAAGLRAAFEGDGLDGELTWEGTAPGKAYIIERHTLAVPPIFTTQRLAAVRAVLFDPSRVVGARAFYLLSRGRMTAPCGENYHGMIRRDRVSRQYRCGGEAASPRCDCRRLDAEQVEEAVWSAVVDLLGQPERLVAMAQDFLATRRQQVEVERDQAATVERKIAEVKGALHTTVTDYARAGVAGEVVAEAVRTFQDELNALERHRAQLQAWRADTTSESERVRRLWGLADLAHSRLHTLTPQERARVLTLLQVRVSVLGWHDCGACEGKGRTAGGDARPRRRGGYRCETCRGLKKVASVRVEGVIVDRLSEALSGEGDFGNVPGLAS